MAETVYRALWIAFIQIKAKSGLEFNDLVDIENKEDKKYIGAFANVLVKAKTINTALDIIPLGMAELGFEIVFIDKVENLQSLVEHGELKEDVLTEADWLLESNYVFKISDRLFPYSQV